MLHAKETWRLLNLHVSRICATPNGAYARDLRVSMIGFATTGAYARLNPAHMRHSFGSKTLATGLLAHMRAHKSRICARPTVSAFQYSRICAPSAAHVRRTLWTFRACARIEVAHVRSTLWTSRAYERI